LKIAVECKSPLLQKSLEIFLSRYISSTKHCDIVVRDEVCLADERCFYISSDEKADLIKPFSKAQLIFSLEEKLKSMDKTTAVVDDEPLDFAILEKRIDYLTKEYQANILTAVRAFYEK